MKKRVTKNEIKGINADEGEMDREQEQKNR